MALRTPGEDPSSSHLFVPFPLLSDRLTSFRLGTTQSQSQPGKAKSFALKSCMDLQPKPLLAYHREKFKINNSISKTNSYVDEPTQIICPEESQESNHTTAQTNTYTAIRNNLRESPNIEQSGK